MPQILLNENWTQKVYMRTPFNQRNKITMGFKYHRTFCPLNKKHFHERVLIFTTNYDPRYQPLISTKPLVQKQSRIIRFMTKTSHVKYNMSLTFDCSSAWDRVFSELLARNFFSDIFFYNFLKKLSEEYKNLQRIER